MRWAYGVTTCPERRKTLLPITLASLKKAGFGEPRLFVDGASEKDYAEWAELGLELTFRYPRMRVFGNWILALGELFIRDPGADRYVIFQDDIMASKNLRGYLEQLPYPDEGYWNIYTFPMNETLRPEGYIGFYPSNQLGKGALGLVFDRRGVITLLKHDYVVRRPPDPKTTNDAEQARWWKCVDGMVATALAKDGYKEYVHYPSLLQHTGGENSLVQVLDAEHKVESGRLAKGSRITTDRPARWTTTSFRGEEYDLLQLVPTGIPTPDRIENMGELELEMYQIHKAIEEDEQRFYRTTDPDERRRIYQWQRKYKEKLTALANQQAKMASK